MKIERATYLTARYPSYGFCYSTSLQVWLVKLKAFKSVKAVTAAFALPFNKVAFDLYATNVSNIVMLSYVLTEVHPWKLRFSCYNHHKIGSVHLSHCYHILPWLCVWDIVALYFVTYCIFSPGKPGFCFHYHCAVYYACKWSDTFWVEDRIRLFVHYTISLSSLCKFVWRHWTYKMPVRYSLSSVWVR